MCALPKRLKRFELSTKHIECRGWNLSKKVFCSTSRHNVKRNHKSIFDHQQVHNKYALTNTLTKQIDGMYKRLLRMVGETHLTNNELYGNLPKISVKIRQRRMRLADHCTRHEDEIANKLVLWQPTDGRVKRGRQKINYIDVLLQDTGVTSTAELKTIMLDRSDWRGRVQNVVWPGGRPK